MDRVGEDAISAGPQAPAVFLPRNAEVTPKGVGICAAGHPEHRGCIWTSRDGPLGRVHAGTLPGCRRGNLER